MSLKTTLNAIRKAGTSIEDRRAEARRAARLLRDTLSGIEAVEVGVSREEFHAAMGIPGPTADAGAGEQSSGGDAGVL